MTIAGLYRQVRQAFRKAGLDNPDLDARILVAAGLGISVSQMLLCGEGTFSREQEIAVENLASKRLKGVPVGRILGRREFWGLEFRLNDAALEPRPDTETLVEAVLTRTVPSDPMLFADIGTGTGAIAISLLTERPGAVGIAVDISSKALDCALKNALQLNVATRFFPVLGSYAAPLAQRFDWVISNPPYIRSGEIRRLSEEVRTYDPLLALDGGTDGLEAYRALIRQAAYALADDGRIAVEIGYDQANPVIGLLRQGGFSNIEVIRDLSGKDRVLVAERNEMIKI